MEYIGWPYNVNKRIIDSTSVTVGDGATLTDNVEGSSSTKKRMVSANPSDKYSVTMHFNCYEKDKNGLTEKDRFFAWYKGIHKYGTVPFEFPSILWNSNKMESFDTEEVERGNIPKIEYYTISSPVEGSKLGFDIAVTMTWQTYSTGVYEVPYTSPSVSEVEFHNGYCIVQLEAVSNKVPVSSDFILTDTYAGETKTLSSYVYSNEDDSTFLYLVFTKLEMGLHNLKVEYKGKTPHQIFEGEVEV